MKLPRPRIGFYQPYPHTCGGMQVMTIKLATALPDFGYEPLIISPEEGRFTSELRTENLPYWISDPGQAWHVYGRGNQSLSYLLSLKRLVQLVQYWRRLSQELRRHNVSLLHCNEYRGVILAAPAARLAGIPVLWHMHGFHRSWLANLVAASLVHWTVPVSQGMLEYVKLPRWLFGKYQVIHNGIEAAWLEENAEAASGSAPVILAVGTLHPCKGFEILFHSLKQVVQQFPEMECWIAGGDYADGRYGQQLRELAHHLGLASNLRFLGYSSQIRKLMQRCTVVAVPSHIETFGLVAIEAMLAGKPVVACRTGGLQDIVIDQETGALVEPGHAQDMAGAILKILRNKPLAQKMGQAGQQRVLEKFTLEKTIASFAALYGKLLHGFQSPELAEPLHA